MRKQGFLLTTEGTLKEISELAWCAGARVRYEGRVPFCAAESSNRLTLGVPMKIHSLALFASLVIPSVAYADVAKVHAFIGIDQMRVKATSLEVTLSSNLENMKIDDERVQRSGTFLLRCGDDGKQYAMITIPNENDVWPAQKDELRTTADVVAFGSDLEISGSYLVSMTTGRDRLLYVDLGNKISEFVRHWYTGMSVRISTKPGNGLADLSFIVAAPAPDADARQKIAQMVALCQILAR